LNAPSLRARASRALAITPAALSVALLTALAPGAATAAAGAGDVTAVSGLSCIHRKPWVCTAPAGTFSFQIRLSSAGVAAVGRGWPFTMAGPQVSVNLGFSDVAAGAALPFTVHAAGSGVLTLALGTPAALTVYVGAGKLPPWPGTPRTALPTANLKPPGVSPFASAAAQEQTYLAALTAARRQEGIAAWRLPKNFARLSAIDQVFVLTNLERVSRGLWPLWAVSSSLDAIARVGAVDHTDPIYHGAAAAWGSNWYGGTDPAAAMFLWMYDDGAGSWDYNVDCPRAGASGCWGHRKNVLGSWGPYGLFGAADVDGGTTEVMVEGVTPVESGLQYTWADAVRMGARPAA
jgi:hypothetical protein